MLYFIYFKLLFYALLQKKKEFGTNNIENIKAVKKVPVTKKLFNCKKKQAQNLCIAA